MCWVTAEILVKNLRFLVVSIDNTIIKIVQYSLIAKLVI